MLSEIVVKYNVILNKTIKSYIHLKHCITEFQKWHFNCNNYFNSKLNIHFLNYYVVKLI